MGKQVIRQPSGRYAVFCSNEGAIVLRDATEEKIVEWFADRAAEGKRAAVRRLIAHVAAGEQGKAYHQAAMTWAEALEQDREHGGTVWQEEADRG